MHAFEMTVRLQHTDAAGVVFFARFFEIVHLAFEDLLDALGHPLPADLAQATVAYPIVHASADYRAPLRLGDRITVEVEVAEVKSRSFTLDYRILRAPKPKTSAGSADSPAAVATAKARTVHVAVDGNVRGHWAELPQTLREALEAARRV